MHRIGIDLGGTKFYVILSGEDVTQVIHEERHSTNPEAGYEDLVSRIAGVVQRIEQKFELKDYTVGIGIPGTLDRDFRVRFSNTKILTGKLFKQDLEKAMHRKVYMENDANCFVLSETLYGAAKGQKIVLGVTLGTGIGGGIVIDNKPVSGANGIAGEFGHADFFPGGRKNWNGRVGEFESYLSGTGAKEWFRELYGEDKSFPEVIASYRNGEKQAQDFMKLYLDYFGRAMANLINFLDPNVIVFGGGISKFEEIYTEGRKCTEKYVFGDEFHTAFLPPKLHDYSGVFGAASLFASSDNS